MTVVAAPLADVDDLQALMPGGTFDEAAQEAATALLVRASQLLRVKVPWVDAKLATGDIDPMVVATVVAGVVKRSLVNPSGAIAVGTGPYSVTFQTRTGTGNDGGLRVTVDDVAALSAGLGGVPVSVRLVPGLAPRVAVDRQGRVTTYGLAGYPTGLAGVPGDLDE